MNKVNHIILSLIVLIGFQNIWSQSAKPKGYEFGEGIRLETNEGHAVKITTYIQPHFESRFYTDPNEESNNRFRMRRARLRIDGESANERWSYRFQMDLSGQGEFEEQDGAYLLDAVVNYKINNDFTVSFGQRPTFTDNRELLTLSNTLQLVERSRVTSAFASIREFGLFLNGTIKTGRNSFLRPHLVLTNGDGGNVFTPDFGGLKIGGRLDYLPFGKFSNLGQFRQVDVTRELTPKLVIGTTYSNNNGMSSRRGRASGDILYLNDNSDFSLPSYEKYGIDFMFKYQGFVAIGEFVKSTASVPDDITQRILNNGNITRNFLVNGVQDVNNLVRSRMMLGEGYNIQMGYLFKSGISLDGRYTHLKSDEHSFLNNPTFYNRPNYYTLGVSKYFARNHGAKIQADVTYVDGNQINNNLGLPIEGNEWIARIMLTIAL